MPTTLSNPQYAGSEFNVDGLDTDALDAMLPKKVTEAVKSRAKQAESLAPVAENKVILPAGEKGEARRLEPPIFTCLISVVGLGARAAAFSARVVLARKGYILPLPSPSMKGRHRNGRRATYLQRGDTGSCPREGCGRSLAGFFKA